MVAREVVGVVAPAGAAVVVAVAAAPMVGGW